MAVFHAAEFMGLFFHLLSGADQAAAGDCYVDGSFGLVVSYT